MTSLDINLQSVRERIAAAALRVGRDPADVTLVAVTKSQPVEVIRVAYDLGQRHFAENRVEEAESKVSALPSDITWHMIGHIQSRKAKRVPGLFRFVHSVDSVGLARRLDSARSDQPTPLPVLVEINVSGEENKLGFPAARWSDDESARLALREQMAELVALPHLAVIGLMTMAPMASDPEQARPVFAGLRAIRDELCLAFPQASLHHLSMGMTDDFEIAVEEGATLVRIGRAIFAPEQPAARQR